MNRMLLLPVCTTQGRRKADKDERECAGKKSHVSLLVFLLLLLLLFILSVLDILMRRAIRALTLESLADLHRRLLQSLDSLPDNLAVLALEHATERCHLLLNLVDHLAGQLVAVLVERL